MSRPRRVPGSSRDTRVSATVVVAGGGDLGYISGVRTLLAFVVVVSSLLSSTSWGRTCATTALRALPDNAAFGVGLRERPVAVDVTASTTLPLRVHRTAAASTAQAALVLAELERAWALQVDGAGYAPPLTDDGEGGDDSLDVYVAALPAGVSAVTIASDDVDDSAGLDVRHAFMVIAADQPDELLAVAAHHEFQHVLQFAIDADESVMWFEATAVAFEVRGRPDVTSWQEPLSAFQTQPQAPLGADGIGFAPYATSADVRLEYGAALFALYLDDRYGDGDGSVLRRLWHGAAGSRLDGDDVVNEPDWQDALEAFDDAATIQRDFFAWRALAPPLGVGDEGPAAYDLGGGAGLRGTRIVLENLRGTARVTGKNEGPFVGGCLVLGGTAGNSAAPVFLHVESVDGHDLGVTTLIIGNGRVERDDADVGSVVDHDVVVPAGREIVIGICDLADRDVDDAPLFAAVRLSLGREEIVGEGEGEGEPVGEGEGEGEDVIDPGCGCDSTSSGPASGDPRVMRKSLYTVGFFIGIFGFVVKAWRHRRRQRLYKQSRARKP